MYNDSLKDRLWLLLEVPVSSREAKALSIFMIIVIMGSIMVFVMEVMSCEERSDGAA